MPENMTIAQIDSDKNLSNLYTYVRRFSSDYVSSSDFSTDNISAYLKSYNKSVAYACEHGYLTDANVQRYNLSMDNFDYAPDSFALLYKNSVKLINTLLGGTEPTYNYKTNVDSLKQLYREYLQRNTAVIEPNAKNAHTDSSGILSPDDIKRSVSGVPVISVNETRRPANLEKHGFAELLSCFGCCKCRKVRPAAEVAEVAEAAEAAEPNMSDSAAPLLGNN